MRFILAVLFISFTVVSVMAERIIKREKYNLIIASDTVCAGENYDLTVDLKGNKNAIVFRNGYPVPVSDGKGYVRFRGAAPSYDIRGSSKQRLQISIVINDDSLFEDITFFVVKPPMSNTIYRVQDSLTALLLNREDYKDALDGSYYKKRLLVLLMDLENVF